jgi:hypothetical protein
MGIHSIARVGDRARRSSSNHQQIATKITLWKRYHWRGEERIGEMRIGEMERTNERSRRMHGSQIVDSILMVFQL